MISSSIAGIWIWGTPIEMDVDGTKVSVLYLDTEGFESVGKSNVYDDRFVLRCELCAFFWFTFLGPIVTTPDFFFFPQDICFGDSLEFCAYL